MASRSFFIQRPEDARRHIDVLAKGLKNVAAAGFACAACCGVMAIFLARLFRTVPARGHGAPESFPMPGIAFVAWFIALALLFFSALYLVSGLGLAHQKPWARYAAAATFSLKILLCLWLGRRSIGAAIFFLIIASWDLYGLWVMLSNETGQLFRSPEPRPTVV